jgi:anti-sigma factor RsiW
MDPTCGHCQAQLLDYLYDLLEPNEQRLVEQHLSTCAACQAALAGARGQQHLLAHAARLEFPGVRFETPTSLPLSPRRPALTPVRRSWKRWAVAAGLLLALLSGGIVGVGYWNDYNDNLQQIAQHQRLLADAEKKIHGIGEQLIEAQGKNAQEAARLRAGLQEGQLKVVVSGPETVQPGAPTPYEIQTTNADGQPMPAQLDVRVRDETRRVVHEEKAVPSNGHYRLSLPPNLPFKPGSKLAMEVVARREGGQRGEVHEELELAQPLYVTHLTTDKPLYLPTETVHFRSLTLDRFSLTPPEEDFQVLFYLIKPDGSETLISQGKSLVLAHERDSVPMVGPDNKPIRGIGCGEVLIPANAPGGEYTLRVVEANNRFPKQERKFLVNKFEREHLNKELEWSQRSYGPGDLVIATCKVARAEGGKAPNGYQVTASVNIDGVDHDVDGKVGYRPWELTTAADDTVQVKFRLPATIHKGNASLSVRFRDNAFVETLVKPIPIVLNKLLVEFFPEGGDLVAGVPNRVYFQVRSTLGKPADLRGKIVDATGQVVVENVATFTLPDQPGANQGMGAFELTPKLTGQGKYELKIESPTGIQGKYELPVVKDDGVVLSIPNGVSAPGEPIRVVVHSPGADRSLLVGAYCRGRLMDHQTMTVKKGEAAAVELKPAQERGGVYRVTVFEETVADARRPSLVPRAERLVYRQPAEQLKLSVTSDRPQYIPGDAVHLTVAAASERGTPIPAILLLAVVDKSIVTLADEKTARSMPTHFYLSSEVRKPEDLEHADFLLGPHEKARTVLDLLLGTQGWRRFAEQDPEKFRKSAPPEDMDAERLLVSIGQSVPRSVDLLERDLEDLRKKGEEEQTRLEEQRLGAVKALELAQKDKAYAAAQAQVGGYETSLMRFRTFTLPLLGMALILALFVALVIYVIRSSTRLAPLYVGAMVCSLLLLVVLGVQIVEQQRADQKRIQEEIARATKVQSFAPAGGVGMVAPAMPPMAPAAAQGMPPMPARADGPGPAKVMTIGPAKPGQPATPPMAAQKHAVKLFTPNAGMGPGKPLVISRNAENPPGDRVRGGPKRFNQAGASMPAPPGEAEMAGEPVPGQDLHPFVVREYVHEAEESPGEQRTDFTQTLYWQPVLVLPGGKMTVTFGLSDAVTTFQVVAMGHTPDGRLGSVTGTIESRLPLSLEPKVPPEVNANDKIDLPVSVSNNTTEPREVKVQLSSTGLGRAEGVSSEVSLTIPAEQRARRMFRLLPLLPEGGQAIVQVTGTAEPFAADSIRRTLTVVPEGFPFIGSHSDMLEKVTRHEITLPDTWLKGSLQVKAEVYPSTLADLQKGLEGLLREPGGCFEQTSTSNYPNLLILDYLKETDQVLPEVSQKAQRMLASGYHLLSGYECPYTGQKSHGYEWFGAANSAHEALTAYGLLQFRDMARVHPVDAAMLERTRQFLMDQKDSKGGFKRNPRALDTFGRAPDHITNAYIVWALTESGKEDDIGFELNALAEQAKASKDPYFVSLVANSLLNRARADEAVALLKAVTAVQKDDGHLDATATSITGSGGRDLQIETTSLAVLGWLKANRPGDFNAPIQKAVKWIGQQRGGYGGFGATQSTILALKALIGFARANKKTAEAGELRLLIGDKVVAFKSFEAGTLDAITVTLPEPEKHLHAGKNAVMVEITGDKNLFPCTLSWSYRTLKPVSAENVPVRLSAQLDRQTANEGETVHLTVTVENTRNEGQGMAVAIVGLPAGLALPKDLKQLKQHAALRNDGTERGLISYFELRGSRELVLYWRDLAPSQKIEVPIDLICDVPGEYRGPASRAYLYYNGDVKHWIEPLRMTILAKE